MKPARWERFITTFKGHTHSGHALGRRGYYCPAVLPCYCSLPVPGSVLYSGVCAARRYVTRRGMAVCIDTTRGARKNYQTRPPRHLPSA
ncbi:hypothetical protein EVAR_26868_1 [Eumeta japonica]|uniref:Uncharacterized protein n=1 Tax=Eumeta variegata TaxID=151549 RepID=A0A4C1VWK0_EUMVA|nr:hypothetical protein EVAR_26868_1 [Eumeta japonica]